MGIVNPWSRLEVMRTETKDPRLKKITFNAYLTSENELWTFNILLGVSLRSAQETTPLNIFRSLKIFKTPSKVTERAYDSESRNIPLPKYFRTL